LVTIRWGSFPLFFLIRAVGTLLCESWIVWIMTTVRKRFLWVQKKCIRTPIIPISLCSETFICFVVQVGEMISMMRQISIRCKIYDLFGHVVFINIICVLKLEENCLIYKIRINILCNFFFIIIIISSYQRGYERGHFISWDIRDMLSASTYAYVKFSMITVKMAMTS